MPKKTASPPAASPEDDRTVASMNVEGMPWYTPGRQSKKTPNANPLTGKALWRYTFYAVGAGLLVVVALGAAMALFIWFCVHVWFRT